MAIEFYRAIMGMFQFLQQFVSAIDFCHLVWYAYLSHFLRSTINEFYGNYFIVKFKAVSAFQYSIFLYLNNSFKYSTD